MAAAEDSGHGLVGDADDVVEGLLFCEGAASGLDMGFHEPRAFVFGAVAVTHHSCPNSSCGAEFADFFKELVVGVEEVGEAWGEGVDVHASYEAGLDIFHAVAEGEGEFLWGRGAGFSDVVAGDGDGVPFWEVLGLELDGVDDEFDGCFWWIDEFVLCVELFEDVVLECASEGVPGDVALFGHGEVHGPDDTCGAVDCLGDGDGVDGDVFVETVHVFDGVDGDAAFSDFANREHVIGVSAHECWEVKGGGEAGVCFGGCFGGLEEVFESCVGVVGRAEAGELAHGPESGEVAVGEEASGVGEGARVVDVAVEVLEGSGEVVGCVGGIEDDA